MLSPQEVGQSAGQAGKGGHQPPLSPGAVAGCGLDPWMTSPESSLKVEHRQQGVRVPAEGVCKDVRSGLARRGESGVHQPPPPAWDLRTSPASVWHAHPEGAAVPERPVGSGSQ